MCPWSPGVSNSALCDVVEAHKTLAAQEARLQLLMQQLADKEVLLDQARQLVSWASAGVWLATGGYSACLDG